MIIYSILVLFVAVICMPYILLRFKGKELQERLGFLEKQSKSDNIWVHAASVGEVNAAADLIKKISEVHSVIVTTMTATGQKRASSLPVKTFFIPFDCIFMMLRAFKRLQPKAIVLVETEFWPNMLWLAKLRNIPVYIINARLSDSSYKNYSKTRFFWKTPWRAVQAVSAQSEKDARRFQNLGFPQVENNGNLKFSMQLPSYNKTELRKQNGYSEQDFILVWGSSRPGEEDLLREIISQLRSKILQLKVIVVPRHLQRLPEVKQILPDFRLYSQNQTGCDIIVNRMGLLVQFYAMADLAIVGGSFFDFGGHNPLEPAYYGLPIIMGPFFSSCHDSVEKLQKNKAIVISNQSNLKNDIFNLVLNQGKLIEMGANAKKTVIQNNKNLEATLQFLAERLVG
jgi:3-deoxy-D-manno-octulosonic-acid transferase